MTFKRTWRGVSTDLLWGVTWGTYFAIGLSVIVSIIYALRRSVEFPRYQTTAMAVILSYFGAALIGGTVLGALRPWANRQLGAIVVGAFVGSIAFASVAITGTPDIGWHNVFVAPLTGIPVGAWLGNRFWHRRDREGA